VTRFAAILLALSLAAGGALAASPEAAYLAVPRNTAIAEIKALEDSKASESAIQAAEDKAVADLEKRLSDIVGPVAVRGFPPRPRAEPCSIATPGGVWRPGRPHLLQRRAGHPLRTAAICAFRPAGVDV
jgi:hypothetical protein